MITCPSCHAENRAEAKFCDKCGHKLVPICPGCTTENRPGARYCDHCGRSLAAAVGIPNVPSAPQRSAESLMPARLAEKLRDAEISSPSEERRVITMLFCDVKGSTAAAEQMDPERWQEIINGAFKHMIEPIYRYEGLVARLMGDGLLAFFGAPIAHEDDPERAVLAALEIVERVDTYCWEVGSADGLTIAVRVGINTGLVLVGRVGTDQHAEYTAMGNAINVAARMEQTAVPGTVQVADPTYQATFDRFEWESLGPTELKGQSQPIETHRPLRALRNVRDPGRTKLVGRSAQLSKMTESVEQLDLGIGSVVLLTGEAGLGKSRLIAEMSSRLPEAGWIEASAASYEAETPFALIRRLVTSLYAKDWTPAAFEEIDESGDRVTLEHLVAPRPGEADPSGFGDSLALALRRLIALRSGPVVMVCDSLQWADDASLEVLATIAASTTDEAIALVCALRPDPRPALVSFQASLQNALPQLLRSIPVEPLSDGEMSELLEQIAPDLTPDHRARLVPRLGGNPLFAEEVTRSLSDNGEASVPESLLALLVAKLDRLDDETKRAAQLASILGEDFGSRVLEEMGGGDSIPELLRSRVLVEAARLPERRLAFRHGVMRDAAYSTVPHRDRVRYHRLAGEAIERLEADDLHGSAELLARQFRLAEDSRAVRYEIMAGRRAQALSAANEAIALLERARSGFRSDASVVTSAEAIDLHLSLARAYELAGRHPDARDLYQELLGWARSAGDRRAELAALSRLALIHSRTSPLVDPPRGWEYAEEGLTLAAELGDAAADARLSWVTGHLEDDSAAKAARFEHALELLQTVDEQELRAFVLNDMYQPYAQTGRVEEAVAALHEARKLWEGLGNKAMLGDSLTSLGLIAEVRGEMDDAEKFYSEAGAIGAEIGSDWLEEISLIQRSGLDSLRGSYGRWWETMKPYASQESFGLPDAFASQPLVNGYLALGRYRDMLQLADRLEPTIAGMFAPWWADLHALRAIAFHALGRSDDAEEAYARAWELDGEWEAPLISQTPFRMSLYRANRFIDLADWAAAEAAVDRYERRMRPLEARVELGRAAALRATIAEARGGSAEGLYLAAAEMFEPVSDWLHAEMMYRYGNAAGDSAVIDSARVVVEMCLSGLPTRLLSEIDAVPWLQRLLA